MPVHMQPWFRGEYHQIEGSIVEIGNESQPLYTISGNWKRQVVATNTATKEKTVIYSVETKVHDYQTKGLNEQSELESLRCAVRPCLGLHKLASCGADHPPRSRMFVVA